MILTDAITQVRSIIKEPIEAFWKDTEITSWLNEGNQDFHSWKGIQDIWTTTVLIGDTDVGTNDDMVRLSRLTFKGTNDTIESLVNSDTYDLFETNILFDSPLLAGTLTFYGERLPVPVVSGADSFEIDVPFESALIDYACFRAFEKDEDQRMSFALSNYLTKKQMWERKRFDKFNGTNTLVQKRW